DRVILPGDPDDGAIQPFVWAIEEAAEHPELVQHFHRRGVDRIATEIAEEVRMFFKHSHRYPGAGEQQARHHSGRAAAHNRDIGSCRVHCPSDIQAECTGPLSPPLYPTLW